MNLCFCGVICGWVNVAAGASGSVLMCVFEYVHKRGW